MWVMFACAGKTCLIAPQHETEQAGMFVLIYIYIHIPCGNHHVTCPELAVFLRFPSSSRCQMLHVKSLSFVANTPGEHIWASVIL